MGEESAPLKRHLPDRQFGPQTINPKPYGCQTHLTANGKVYLTPTNLKIAKYALPLSVGQRVFDEPQTINPNPYGCQIHLTPNCKVSLAPTMTRPHRKHSHRHDSAWLLYRPSSGARVADRRTPTHLRRNVRPFHHHLGQRVAVE